MKLIFASLLVFTISASTVYADVRIKPIQRGPIPGRPSIGEFEKKQKVTRFVTSVVQKSGLDVAMKEQPNDLRNLIKVLVNAYRSDDDAADTINAIDLQPLPRGRKARQEVQFDMQMTLTLLAGEFGYREQDN